MEVDDALAKILDPNWKPGGTAGVRSVPSIPVGRQKPPNSPDFQKWIDDEGSIEFVDGGALYTDKDGVGVLYWDDMYPDFKGAGAVVDEVDIRTYKAITSRNQSEITTKQE